MPDFPVNTISPGARVMPADTPFIPCKKAGLLNIKSDIPCQFREGEGKSECAEAKGFNAVTAVTSDHN